MANKLEIAEKEYKAIENKTEINFDSYNVKIKFLNLIKKNYI